MLEKASLWLGAGLIFGKLIPEWMSSGFPLASLALIQKSTDMEIPDGRLFIERSEWVNFERLREVRKRFVAQGLMSEYHLHFFTTYTNRTILFFKDKQAYERWVHAVEPLIDRKKGEAMGYRFERKTGSAIELVTSEYLLYPYQSKRV